MSLQTLTRRTLTRQSPTRQTPKQPAWLTRRRVAIALACIGAGVALTAWFDALSMHIVAGSADGATVVLEGASINDGLWALHGWALSLDSFWSIDAQFYALAIRLIGLRPELLHLVPALFAALVVIAASYLARDGLRGRGALIAVVLVGALVALPSPDLSYFLLNGPWHIGTTLWCLLAFIGISRDRYGWPFALAVAMLSTGLLGDLLIVPFGLAPIAAGGLLAAIRARSWRAAIRPNLAVGASVLGAFALRGLADLAGTFTLSNRNVPIRLSQVGTNLSHLKTELPGMFGVGSIPIKLTARLSLSNGAGWLQVMHLLGFALVVMSVAIALWRLGASLISPGHAPEGKASRLRIDDLLLVGLSCCLVVFVWAVPDDNTDYDKYLTAGVIYAAILCARIIGRAASQPIARHRGSIAALALGTSLALSFGLDTALALGLPAPTQPTERLGAFLLAHHLRDGIGDYWSSSLVTVETAGQVTVRPIDTTPKGHLVRFGHLSSADWYRNQHFQFLVYDSSRPWHDVNAKTAAANYGPPAATYRIGTYVVLVWGRPLRVSTATPDYGSPLQVFLHKA